MFKGIRNKKGFTMIELLIVVLIISLLVGIAFPVYQKAVEKSRASEAISMLGDIAKSEQRYSLQTAGDYTQNINALDIAIRPYTPEDATNSSFDTEYFDFQLSSTGADARRKTGKYVLTIDFRTSAITCEPQEEEYNAICQGFGFR